MAKNAHINRLKTQLYAIFWNGKLIKRLKYIFLMWWCLWNPLLLNFKAVVQLKHVIFMNLTIKLSAPPPIFKIFHRHFLWAYLTPKQILSSHLWETFLKMLVVTHFPPFMSIFDIVFKTWVEDRPKIYTR